MAGSGMQASGWGVFQSQVGGGIAAAVVGGTASELGGGKFADGAVTGAYTMLFNHMAHRPGDPLGNQNKQKKSGQVELEKAIEKAAELQRERYISYLTDYETNTNISVQFPSDTKSGWYMNSELSLGGKTLEADIFYRNYGDNVVSIIGWPRHQPYTSVQPAGSKIHGYAIWMKNINGGEKALIFFNQQQHYSHFQEYILGK